MSSRKAKELGEEPLAYCDRMAGEFLDVWRAARHVVRRLHPDDRAAPPRGRAGAHPAHHRGRGHLRGVLRRAGTASSCEAFKQEKDLVEGLCPIHRTKPDWIREKNYFFRLSKYQEPLLEHFSAASRVPDRRTIRRNEILRLIEAGLEDISRQPRGAVRGAFPMPQDPSSVVYVWFDALINYISAVGSRDRRGAAREVVAGRPARHRARTSRASIR